MDAWSQLGRHLDEKLLMCVLLPASSYVIPGYTMVLSYQTIQLCMFPVRRFLHSLSHTRAHL